MQSGDISRLRPCNPRQSGEGRYRPVRQKPYTVRGFLAGVVRKKLALTLQSEKSDGERVYRVIGNDADEPQAA